MTIYFEEVNPGDEITDLNVGPLNHIDLVRYSGASGDFNPIHTIPEAAESAGLPGIIAHGFLVMAYAGRCLTGWGGVNSVRQFKVRFTGMTLIGETVTCAGTIKKKYEENGEFLVSGRLTVRGAEDNSLKMKGEFVLALKKRGE